MTRKELAKLLNLSPAALSLVLNHKPGVSEETRRRVLAQVEELGYSSWVRKKKRQSDNLCLVLFKKHGIIVDHHPFILQMMESVESRARKYGLSMLMSTVDSRQELKTQLDRINSLDARGALVIAVEMDEEDVSSLRGMQLPFVCLSNDFARQDVDTVLANNQMGAYQAIEHLIKLGHTRIGYLRSRLRVSMFEQRRNGFINALAAFGLPLRKEDEFTLGYTEQQSYQDFRTYLEQDDVLPSALVADDDTMALGAIKALEEQGWRVPEDISVIGFGDRLGCESIQPPLTSVSVSPQAIGVAAVDALMQQCEREQDDPRTQKVCVSTKLVVRGSTGAYMGMDEAGEWNAAGQ